LHTKNAPNVVWQSGSARTRWGSLYSAPPDVLAALRALPDKVFSDQKCTKCPLVAGLRPDPLRELNNTALDRPLAALKLGEFTALSAPPNALAALRALPDKAFSDKKCTKCCLAAGLHPDPLGELTALPRLPSCIARHRLATNL